MSDWKPFQDEAGRFAGFRQQREPRLVRGASGRAVAVVNDGNTYRVLRDEFGRCCGFRETDASEQDLTAAAPPLDEHDAPLRRGQDKELYAARRGEARRRFAWLGSGPAGGRRYLSCCVAGMIAECS